MKHLTEEELIDVLMDEPRDKALDQHLEACPPCMEQLSVLKTGLGGARLVEPEIPLMARPLITHSQFTRKEKAQRMTWMAAAAILLFGLLGFRMEVGNGKMTMEFAIFGGGDQVSEARIAMLEQDLANTLQLMELQSLRTEEQMNQRFNAVYEDGHYNLEQIRVMLDSRMEEAELQNALYFNDVNDKVKETLRKNGFKGKLQ